MGLRQVGVASAQASKGRGTRLVAADEQPLVLAALEIVLGSSDGVELVATTTSPGALMDVLESSRPDALLLDARFVGPPPDFPLIRSIRSAFPALAILVFGAPGQEHTVKHALANGASAYITKTVEPHDLAPLIRQALGGHTSLIPAPTVPDAGLTPRERSVLRGIAKGLSNKRLAEELRLSEQTVKFHASNAYRKLNVRTRTEAALLLREHPEIVSDPMPRAR